MISVEYVDHMGDDLRVANAARRSFDIHHWAWSEEARTPRGRSDRELVLDLASEAHLLPFRHPQITLACTAPVPVARQLGKHQVGFSWSEVSRRYKTKGLTFHHLEWRAAPAERRQGSGEAVADDVQVALEAIQVVIEKRCLTAYQAALELGASPEQARFLLPQSMDVSWTWTGSLLAWADLYRKRRHSDTQRETGDFVQKVAEIIQPLFPVSWEGLTR